MRAKALGAPRAVQDRCWVTVATRKPEDSVPFGTRVSNRGPASTLGVDLPGALPRLQGTLSCEQRVLQALQLDHLADLLG